MHLSECGETRLGQLVISKMGRDRGRLCVVVRRLDDCAVLIADGRMHKFARPKRKNVKHLIRLNNVDTVLEKKLAGSLEVTDTELTEALDGYKAKGAEGGHKPEHEQG
jgi:large subunit ribosomal protein L14e